MARLMALLTYRTGLAALTAIGASCVLNACLIDERAVDEECFAFYSVVQEKCAGEYAVYPSHEACMAVCRELDRGTPGEEAAGQNTLECRLQALPSLDRGTCRDVGPGGNGKCGDDCAAFCSLRQQACADLEPTADDIADRADCLGSCQRLPGSDGSGMAVPVGSDSLQCRLGFLSAALVSKSAARAECPSTSVTLADDAKCRDDPNYAEPDDCTSHCALVMRNCRDDFQVYETMAQCEAVCSTFEPGIASDDRNTMQCRKYHANSAAAGPDVHCVHSGPTGDGHCGGESGNCDSLCTLVEQACGEGFARVYGGRNACLAACGTLPDRGYDGLAQGSPLYSVNNATQIDEKPTPTLACRVLHAARAMQSPNDPVECAAALAEPGSPCE